MDIETNNAEVENAAPFENEGRELSSAHHHRHHDSHSHHRHSSHRRKKRRSKSKRYAFWRTIFSFMLFLCVSATAVFLATRLTVLNEDRVSRIFTNEKYLASLHADVLEYSQDLCLKYGIPDDCVKDTITYESISNIQNAYTLGQLDMDEMYSSTTYSDIIKALNKELAAQTETTIKANSLEIDESVQDGAVQKFADEVSDYITKKVEFKYTSDLQSIFNVSSTVLIIGIILFAILSVAFFLLTISFAEKRYRAFRSVSFSVFGAAGLNLLMVISVGIVAIFKNFLIYPLYLCDSVMSYIGSCVLTFLACAIVLFILGTMNSALVWRLKRNNE